MRVVPVRRPRLGDGRDETSLCRAHLEIKNSSDRKRNVTAPPLPRAPRKTKHVQKEIRRRSLCRAHLEKEKGRPWQNQKYEATPFAAHTASRVAPCGHAQPRERASVPASASASALMDKSTVSPRKCAAETDARSLEAESLPPSPPASPHIWQQRQTRGASRARPASAR